MGGTVARRSALRYRAAMANAPPDDAPKTRDFGSQTVTHDEHAALVRGVFDSVARRYDVMNDLMSGGLHRLWKDAAIDWLAPRPGTALLDLAGGTGDIAFRFLDRVARDGSVLLCDANLEMLSVGRDRALDRGFAHGLDFVCADAASLPLPSMTFDYATIAFGLRNVTEREAALSEARRVLKPGGRFLCLEFSPHVLPLLAPLYDAYSERVLPALGRAVAGDAESYRYLAESIRRFPDPDALDEALGRAGFGAIRHRLMSGGIVALHSGWRV